MLIPAMKVSACSCFAVGCCMSEPLTPLPPLLTEKGEMHREKHNHMTVAQNAIAEKNTVFTATTVLVIVRCHIFL